LATFLKPKGNYRSLIVYQKAECIYDISYYFAYTFLSKGDRTIDQMVQAARSGKQNIAEGSSASTTSSETELKLINVARASFQELLVDFEDYLRTHNLELWSKDDVRYQQTREVCAKHNDTAFYIERIKQRSDATIANIAITLIHQEDKLLTRLLERLQDDFVKNGGIREQMTAARLAARKRGDTGAKF
jgi:four helix bundle suffix protein